MKFTSIEPPRTFETGRGEVIQIKDCARIALDTNEQVTFVTPGGAEYDVARKSWGFYATPSINGRLLTFGLRTALIKSYIGKYYVFLIERGKEDELKSYLDRERNALVRWLDNDADLAAVEGIESDVADTSIGIHCPCSGDRFTTVHTYFSTPAGEVHFPRKDGTDYRREVFRCSLCGHFVSIHGMSDASLYGGGYVDATYGDPAGMRRAFERIVGLPRERSDNAGRVNRIVEFAKKHFGADRTSLSVLDVGSGLCVFLNAMKAQGWQCTALDPDPRAAEHAKNVVGVHAEIGDFMALEGLGQFDLITFNKVLEHVKDPIAMLSKASRHLRPGGLVYIELPDGEAAVAEGFGREEFFIEHFHIFSAASVSILSSRAGFSACSIERLREPSTKFTIRAFLVPTDTASSG